MVVDSCLADDWKTPAPLKYMAEMGLDVQHCVCAVVATHWHDDHIKGLSSVLNACGKAKFWCSAAMTSEEFIAFLDVHDNQPTARDRGGTEMLKCLKLMEQSGTTRKPLLENTLIADWPHTALAHGKATRFLALSPSSKQFDRFLRRIGTELRALDGRAKRRLAADRNELSIATLLEVGDMSVLLGADLEDSPDPELGWAAVVRNRSGKDPKSATIKIPHHGSKGAHRDDVWSELLANDVLSVVTPWRLAGRTLPTVADRTRIAKLSKEAYITAENPRPSKKRYPRQVDKHLRRLPVRVESTVYGCGHVRLRFPARHMDTPKVELFNGAVRYHP